MTEELKNQQAATQQAATTPATGAGAQPSRTDNINALYDAQKQAQLNNLQSAYEQNLSNLQAQRDKLPGQYRESANNLAVQYERNRLNQNRQFAANGINTGAASQAALSRSNEYLRDFGRLKAEENKAIADADRGINDLTAAYNRNVAAAGADVEANRTKALLDEQNRQQQLDLNKAQLLAQYGDFSVYANLYGQDVANNMAAMWKAQNPDLAYRTGNMSAEEYRAMTGKYPAGYNAPNSGGGGYVGTVRPSDEEFLKAREALLAQSRDYTSDEMDAAMFDLYKQYGRDQGKDTIINLQQSKANQLVADPAALAAALKEARNNIMGSNLTARDKDDAVRQLYGWGDYDVS